MKSNLFRPCPRALTELWPVVLLTILVHLGWAPQAAAEVYCVGTAAELQAALDEAADNWTNDYVLVQRGEYVGSFFFRSHQHWPVSIRGGYDATCSTRVDDPATTVLDAEGEGQVLNVEQYAGGGISIRGLTLQNGTGLGGLYAVVLNHYDVRAIEDIRVAKNIIRDGRGLQAGRVASIADGGTFGANLFFTDNLVVGNDTEQGFSVQMGFDGQVPVAGHLRVTNNVVTGNTSLNSAGGLRVSNYDTGQVHVTNNTITQNWHVHPQVVSPGGLSIASDGDIFVYNNIVQGNHSSTINNLGGQDLRVHYFSSTPVGTAFHNVYGDVVGSWHVEDQNQDVEPAFVDRGFWSDNGTPGVTDDDYWVPGDYRLRLASPCIDAGTQPPFPGELPLADFEGDPRVIDGDQDGVAVVDIGADEVTANGIFDDGFESGDTSAWTNGAP